jgi:membrane-associated PAP2 superfamily phosphatase
LLPGGIAVALALATLFLRTTDLELDVQRLFYSESGDRWPWKNHVLPHSLYTYGVYPAALVGLISFLALVASFTSRRARTWRPEAGFYLLVLVLGPGLIVNTVFKQNWGRPRPHYTEEFGGERAYVPVLSKGERGTSFPSGHSSMGFFMLTPYFRWRHTRRRRAWAFLALGLGLGGSLGLTRMVQGMHYLSDVVWSCGIVALVAALLAPAFGFGSGREAAERAPRAPRPIDSGAAGR